MDRHKVNVFLVIVVLIFFTFLHVKWYSTTNADLETASTYRDPKPQQKSSKDAQTNRLDQEKYKPVQVDKPVPYAQREPVQNTLKKQEPEVENKPVRDPSARPVANMAYIPVDNLILIPEDDKLKELDMFELEEIYMRYVENIQQACGRMHHMGGEYDCGYHVCEPYIEKNNCLVYSFGSRKMYQFEDEVEKTYGCEIHTFDPFDGQEDHQRSEKVTFHKIGLSDKNDGIFLTLKSIKEKLKQSHRKLDVLKIDIEGAEWSALPEIYASGEFLNKVKTFIVEFHTCLCDNRIAPSEQCTRFRTKELYLSRLKFLKGMYDLGYRVYFFRQWTWCRFKTNDKIRTGCHEVHFMKID